MLKCKDTLLRECEIYMEGTPITNSCIIPLCPRLLVTDDFKFWIAL